MAQHTPYRSGTVLIVVAGISGLLASIALAFIARIQNNSAGDQEVLKEAQARIMLVAACNYIQEASRIGWESKQYKGIYHTETYGWIDVRDGHLGPKYNSFPDTISQLDSLPGVREVPFYDPSGSELDKLRKNNNGAFISGKVLFPIGEARRFPMYLWQRPPYAIKNRVCYNPIETSPTASNYTGLKAYLRFPDPLPAIDNTWNGNASNPGGSTSATTMNKNFEIWAQGDDAPRAETVGISWFRILREPAGATFIVTCGAGGTLGWRDWKELTSTTSGDPDLANYYFGNETGFKAAQQGEVRHWYRVEWSAAVAANDNHLLFHHNQHIDNYRLWPINYGRGSSEGFSQLYTHNMGGTIQWVQRLRQEPANW